MGERTANPALFLKHSQFYSNLTLGSVLRSPPDMSPEVMAITH